MARIYRTDLHINSPILLGELDYLLEACQRNACVKDEHVLLSRHIQVDRCLRPGSFVSDIMKILETYRHQEKAARPMNVAIQAALYATTVSLNAHLANTGYNTRSAFRDPILTKEISHWGCWKSLIQDLIHRISSSVRVHMKERLGPFDVKTYGNLVTIDHPSWVYPHLCTYVQLLNIKSIIYSHFDVLLYSRAADDLGKYPDVSLYNMVSVTLAAMRHDVHCRQEACFDFFKQMPVWGVAVVLRDQEQTVERRFSDRVYQEMQAVGSHVGRYLFSLDCKNIVRAHAALETSGLWKCCGFPIVDSPESARKMRALLTSRRSVDAKVARAVRNTFVKSFCRDYYHKHRTWPSVAFEASVPDPIKRSAARHMWLEPQGVGWPSGWFEGVALAPTFHFDYHVDPTDLIKDTALIGRRCEWPLEYDPDAYYLAYGERIPRAFRTSNRVLLSYLTTPTVDVKSIIDGVEREGRLPHDDCIQVIVWKEKELKRAKARGFGKTTANSRLYQTVTEKNLADCVLPHQRHQSMNMTEVELDKTLSNLTSLFRSPTQPGFLFISMDFQSWCLTQEEEAVSPVFKEIDNLFGLTCTYQYSCRFPSDCLYVLQDRFHPPRSGPSNEPIETWYSTRAATKWLEGLRQKGWTVVTSAMIEHTAQSLDMEASILGQGDNQVVVIKLPPGSRLESLGLTPDRYGQMFIRELHSVCESMGMVLKPDETWVSTVLVEYAKRYYLRGAEVSSALKRVARIANETNSGFQTLSSGVSSVFSAAVGVARCDTTPLLAYFIACVEAGSQISSRLRVSVDQLTALLLTPGQFGGLPVVAYSSLAVRGSLDPATEGLFLIRYIASHYPTLFHDVSRVVVKERGSGRMETIILDPYSLNLSLPRVSETWIREILEEHLPAIVRNEDIKSLFSATAKSEKEKLIADLSNLVPFSPRVGNYILGLSNICLRERVLTKFTSSSSVRRVVSEEAQMQESDFREMVRDADDLALDRIRLALKGPASTLSQVQRGHDAPCSFVATQDYRDEVWGRVVHGVTMPEVGEQVTLCRPGSQVDSGACILIRVDEKTPGHVSRHLQRGSHPPYIGGKTRLRQKKSALETVETHALATSLRLVHQARSWIAAECTELSRLFEVLHSEKTTIPESVIREVSPTIVGGSVSHRLQDQASRTGALINSLLNFSSHCAWNSDSLTRFSKSSLNYTICFQAVVLGCLSRLSILETLGVDVDGLWLAEFRCAGCTAEVPSNVHDLSRSPQYSGLSMPRPITSLLIQDRVTRVMSLDLLPEIEMAATIGRYVGREAYHTSARSVGGLVAASTGGSAPQVNINLTELVRSNTRHLIGSTALHFLLAADGNTVAAERHLQALVANLARSPISVLVRSLCEAGRVRQLCSLVGCSTDNPVRISIRTHFWIAEQWIEGPSVLREYLALPITATGSEITRAGRYFAGLALDVNNYILRPEADIVARARETQPDYEVCEMRTWSVPQTHPGGLQRSVLGGREEMLCVYLFGRAAPSACMLGLFGSFFRTEDRVIVLGNPDGEVAQFLWRMAVLDKVPVVGCDVDLLRSGSMQASPRFLAADPCVPKDYFDQQLRLWLRQAGTYDLGAYDVVVCFLVDKAVIDLVPVGKRMVVFHGEEEVRLDSVLSYHNPFHASGAVSAGVRTHEARRVTPETSWSFQEIGSVLRWCEEVLHRCGVPDEGALHQLCLWIGGMPSGEGVFRRAVTLRLFRLDRALRGAQTAYAPDDALVGPIRRALVDLTNWAWIVWSGCRHSLLTGTRPLCHLHRVGGQLTACARRACGRHRVFGLVDRRGRSDVSRLRVMCWLVYQHLGALWDPTDTVERCIPGFTRRYRGCRDAGADD